MWKQACLRHVIGGMVIIMIIQYSINKALRQFWHELTES